MTKKLHIHFMGIGGSGMAPIAIISKHLGYEVSGCDLSVDGYYCGALTDENIVIQSGHCMEHLEGVDILAVSPAIFDLNPDHPEILEGRQRNILMTWQEFTGKYLQKDKFVIAVAGTHGKSTTTVLMGATLEDGGYDPLVEAGTVYRPWKGGYRIGSSEYFVCEADEFNNNFLSFSPSIAIINNIEMDHPEFFQDFSQVKEAFKSFIRNLKGRKILVVNEESPGIREVLLDMKEYLRTNNIKTIGYYQRERFDFPFACEYEGKLVGGDAEKTIFEVKGPNGWDTFTIGVIGSHNVMNSLGVLAVSLELGMDVEAIQAAFSRFKGIGRRSEFIGEAGSVRFFDDYAHHPTAVAAILDSFRSGYPDATLWAVMEPHQISRMRLFLDEFAAALDKADRVIITKTYVGREKYKNVQELDMNLLIEKISSGKARRIEDFESAAEYVAQYARPGDVVVVIGAGNSYKLTRLMLEVFNKRSAFTEQENEGH